MTGTPHPTTPPHTFVYDVFISYSHLDKTWVHDELLAHLKAHGLTICIDTECFDLGAPSAQEMERAVLTSRKTLLILTQAYLDSDWAQFERLMLQTLDPINRQRRLIPLLLAPCNLPISIKFLNYVSFTDPSAHAQAWSRLLRALTP